MPKALPFLRREKKKTKAHLGGRGDNKAILFMVIWDL